MKTNLLRSALWLAIVLLFVVLFENCSSDAPQPVDTNAAIATDLILDDVTNTGTAQDLQISFAAPADEGTISEYRVFVVNETSNTGFNLATANDLDADRYTSITPSGQPVSQNLPATTKDSDGSDIVEGSAYVAFVLSVADGTNATENTLSAVSNSITIAQTTIKVTYLQNDGVLISDGSNNVIIDAVFTPATGSNWIAMPDAELNKLLQALSPYNNVDIAMTTHSHGDHYGPNSISNFLARSPNTRFIGPPQVTSGLSNQSQVESLSPGFRESATGTVNGIEVEVFNIQHFNPTDGTNFSSTENFAFLVTLGGLNILHIGDGDLSTANFESAGLKDRVDIVLLPTFTFSGQLTTANRDVLINEINPGRIIGLHLATTTLPSTVHAIHPEALVFSSSLQFVRF